MTGIIDPPGAFASVDEWRAFEKEVRDLPKSPQADAAIYEAVMGVARAERLPQQDDDFSDLAGEDGPEA